MNSPILARHRRWPRVLLTLVVVVVLIALAAATFMLSYNGIHVLALNSGVSPQLARIYPGILDAALVIACLAALMLREGKWWARWYAWLAIIVMIVIGAGANAIHAMNVPLPHRESAGVVSAAPWLLLLLAFSLWVTTLRQSRTRRAARCAEVPVPEAPVPEGLAPEVTEPVTEADPWGHSVVPGMTAESELAPAPEPVPAAEIAPTETVSVAETVSVVETASAETVSAEETMPAAEAVWEGDVPAETPDVREPEPEVAETRTSAPSESEASGEFAAPEDESLTSEPPPSGQPAIIGSRPVDYWDAGEDDSSGASGVPAAYDTTDPDPAAGDGAEVVEYSDDEEAQAQARRAGHPLAPEVHHGTAELAPEPPAPSTPELPFFSAPALRRMRSTPVPPEEASDQDS
jgi:hypothetical protein